MTDRAKFERAAAAKGCDLRRMSEGSHYYASAVTQSLLAGWQMGAERIAQLEARNAELASAASAALREIESVMHEAFNSATPVCCGKARQECCGNPDPEWSEYDQRTMDRFAPHQRALNAALSKQEK